MANTEDSFEYNVAASSGDFAGFYLWSNAANWSTGQPPVNGGDVLEDVPGGSDGINIDDLNGLALSSLTLKFTDMTELVGDSLIIGTVIQDGFGSLEAESDGRNDVTVTIGGIVAQGESGGYVADGMGASLIDQAASDSGFAQFDVDHGGTVFFGCAPASTTEFDYNSGDGAGMFVFENPGMVISAKLADVGLGDELEVPGTFTVTHPSPGVTDYVGAVRDVVIGAHSIVVTTTQATYDFTNVTYADEIKGYDAIDGTADPGRITFNDIDSFQQNIAANGTYLWSNVANWTGGVPATASAFTVGAAGVDDLARLLLVNLTLDKTGAEPEILVTGATLSVDDLLETEHAGTALLEADAAAAAKPVSITLYANQAHGVTFDANGAGASFEDQSAPGTIASTYVADHGGRVELLNAPLGTDIFAFGTQATFALPGAAADNLALIEGLRGGDVLELPGTSVSSVNIGASTVDIATSAGNYAFDDVDFAEPISNYTSVYDASTGLEAITFRGTDVFTPKVADANGDYLWSNAANWSEGVPADGDGVEIIPNTTVDSSGYTYALENVTVDDIASLTLSSLLMNTIVDVTGGTLAIGSLGFDPHSLTSDFLLEANSVLDGSPVTVTFNHASLAGVFFVAHGPGARLIDNSPTNASGSWDSYANYYEATDGGFIEIPGAQLAEDFGFGFPNDGFTAGSELGALAFSADTTVNLPNFTGVAPGDVLELPGTVVKSIYFGPEGGQRYPNPSLVVTTDVNTYNFYQIQPDAPIGSYRWAVDPATGLVAITFGPPDVFSDQVSAGSGSLAGDFLWSNAGNWSEGIPAYGGVANYAAGAIGFDDIASLSLGGLTLNSGEVFVTGASLVLGAVTGGAVVADATDAGAPVSVTIGSDLGSGDDFIAQGTGATLLDLSAYDLGNSFTAASGGLVEFSGLLPGLSALDYDGIATIALANPGSLIGAALGIHTGDVLELPGDVVTSVSFGAGSLTIATNEGSYRFSNVGSQLDSATASFDAGTGLEAITFTALDIFSDRVSATSGPRAGDYLWSNAANWSDGVPLNGSDVSMAVGANGKDDLTSLSIGSLTMNGSDLVVTGGSLAVAAVNDDDGTIVSYHIVPPGFDNAGSTYTTETIYVSHVFADSTEAGGPVNISIGNITGIGDSVEFYSAQGAAAALRISSNGPDRNYTATDGGLIEFAGTVAAADIDVEGHATLALANPGPVIGAQIDLRPGDVLALPGSAAGTVSIGAFSLNVLTNAGTFTFSDVFYSNTMPVADYTTAFDPASGLEAITFTGNSIPDLHAGPAQHDVIFANVTAANPLIAGGTVELASGSTVTGDISFSGTGGVLVIDANPDGSTTIPANTITGFAARDTIDLAGVPFSGSSANFGAPGGDSYIVASAGTLTIDAAGTIYNLAIAGATIGQHDFVLSSDLQVTEVTCYAAGTRIATPAGEVAVESLAIGDMVKTLHAGAQKIKWIGTRTYDGRFIAGNKIALPICIKAHAIRANIPARDLWVSPGHAICIDGVLVHAARLVNGVSILQAEKVERISYYHIELQNHEIIFAENCPAETFMGEHFRGLFQNAAEFAQHYPGSAAPERMCLPRLDQGFQLQSILGRLARRAGIHDSGALRIRARAAA